MRRDTLAVLSLAMFAVGANAQSFQLSTVAGLPGTSYGLATGDINHDGGPDAVVSILVLGSSSIGGYQVYKKSPTGFSHSPTFSLPSFVQGVALGDLTKDGEQDAIFAMSLSGAPTISTRVNNGLGGFAASGTNLTLGTFMSSVATADFDLDGNLDVAGASYDDGNVYVLFGNGTGGFGSTTTIPFGPFASPLSINAADLDGDGFIDITVAAGSVSGGIQVIKNNGAASFTIMTAPMPSFSTNRLTVCDVDRDGLIDILSTNNNYNSTGPSLVVYKNGGSFSFPSINAYPYLGINSALTTCDFNGDGLPDVITCPPETGSIMYFFPGLPGGAFGTPSSMTSCCGRVIPAVADIDNDGDADILFVNGSGLFLLTNTQPPKSGTSLFGTGTEGCSGNLGLSVNMPPKVNTPNFGVVCTNAPKFTNGVGIFGDAASFAGYDPFGIHALIYIDYTASSAIGTFYITPDGRGSAFGNIRIPNDPTLANAVFYVQALFTEPTFDNCTAATGDVVTSKGMILTIAP
ncbi:MAG: VCBS repeat-containing protein [Planctomycetes bacterium]|nr:VCBS repeat-containing protein [Planctomycetota bacterium]